MRHWHRMDAEDWRWVEVNSQWRDGCRCWEMDEQVQVSGGREEGGGRIERCGEMNECGPVAV